MVQVLMLHDLNHMGEKQFDCTQCDKTFENTAVLCNNTGLTLEKSHLSALNVVQVLWYSTVFKFRGSELKETNCNTADSHWRKAI